MSHQSGIKSNQNLRNFFAKSKDGNIRMIKVIINDNEELILDSHRNVNNSKWSVDYNDFVLNVVQSKAPCFIFYRLDEQTNSGHMWLFITWSPDFASVKQKMLYASTKSTLKLEFGAGQIKDELFGTVIEDISLDGYNRHLTAQSAPAPLTNREEELEFLRQNENLTRINVDTKHKTMQGVMFPIDRQALDKLTMFKQDLCDYIQFYIDLNGEKIVLDRSFDHLNIDQLAAQIPSDKGRFHLFRFAHCHEGENFKSIIFIYSMPGFSCSVKERMLYSSCKSELLSYLKNQAQIELSKTFEISEPSEISLNYLLDELHPKKLSDNLKFEKPKGPAARGPRRVTRPTTTNDE